MRLDELFLCPQIRTPTMWLRALQVLFLLVAINVVMLVAIAFYSVRFRASMTGGRFLTGGFNSSQLWNNDERMIGETLRDDNSEEFSRKQEKWKGFLLNGVTMVSDEGCNLTEINLKVKRRRGHPSVDERCIRSFLCDYAKYCQRSLSPTEPVRTEFKRRKNIRQLNQLCPCVSPFLGT